MNRTLSSLIACAASILAITGTANAAEDGAKLFQEACAGCHPPTGLTLENKHLSRAQWKEAVDDMAQKDRLDPPLKKDQYEKLLDWLAATHGPANSLPPADTTK